MSRLTIATTNARIDALDAKLDSILAALTNAPATPTPTPAPVAVVADSPQARRAAAAKQLFRTKHGLPKSERAAWKLALGMTAGETINHFVERTVR